MRKKKKNLVRNNKILIRKNLSLEEINKINNKITFHTNTLLDHIKFENISREQNLLINKSIIQELQAIKNK